MRDIKTYAISYFITIFFFIPLLQQSRKFFISSNKIVYLWATLHLSKTNIYYHIIYIFNQMSFLLKIAN